MIAALIRAMRPHQWVKNLLVFASLVFAHRLGEADYVVRSVMAFAIFCLLSSSIYLLNDVVDREADRAHPRKKTRPIASGALPIPVALLAAIVFSCGAVIWAIYLSGLPPLVTTIPPKVIHVQFYALPIAYLLLQIGYSFVLKRMLVVDCICVALGFLFRVHAGSLVLQVKSSDWMLLCTFFFSLMLAFAKRRNEVVHVSDGSGATRETMRRYTTEFLDQLISSLAAISILSYAMYTLAAETVAEHDSKNLIITVPIVVYGVYRYQYLVLQRGEGGDPSRLLFRDRPLILSGLAYLLVVWLAVSVLPPLLSS
jgi:4-hydroxybenzoate polyprenyltransferase